MFNQSTVIEIIKAYLEEVKQAGVHIKSAILFGSYAQNHQREASDIDLALVADEFVSLPILDKNPFRFLHIRREYSLIEAHTFNTVDFERSNAFIDEIKRTGVVIL